MRRPCSPVVGAFEAAGGKTIAIQADMSRAVDVARLFDTVQADLGAGELGTRLIAGTPLGRLGEPADIAPVALFLASADSHRVTGESIRAAGGVRGGLLSPGRLGFK